MSDFPEYRNEVSQFFPACPLCQKKTIETQFNHDWFGRDYIICTNCHAKWHLNFLQGLKSATLVELDTDGRGKGYLRIKYEPTFWYDMIQEKPARKIETPTPAVKDEETVKEKETTKRRKLSSK